MKTNILKIRQIRSIALAIAIAVAIPAQAAETLTWTTIVNNGLRVPGTEANFNSYNQPAINNDGLVVFRARGRVPSGGGEGELVPFNILAVGEGGSMVVEGVFLRDMGLLTPITGFARRGDTVPPPNNTLYNGVLATFTEFPSSPRIDINSSLAVTRGQSLPVYTYLMADGVTESRAGTSGVYADSGSGLQVGASLLGAVREGTAQTLTFPYYSVPDMPAGSRFDVFPGSPTADGTKVAFKGNFTDPTDGIGKTGVYFRDLVADAGHAPTTLVASSASTLIPNQPARGTVRFGATAAPSAANGYVAFTGWDVEEAPTMGGIYRAQLVADPFIETLVGIGDPVPGEPEGATFTNFGEGLSMSENGRYVAFWGTWGSETTPRLLICPADGNKDLLAYCNATYPTGFAVEIPVHQGIFVADADTGRVLPIAKTGEDGITGFTYWGFSGAPPGVGGSEDDDREPPRWRSASFAALAGKPGYIYGPAESASPFQVAFKATRNGVDGIYLRKGPLTAPLETAVETLLSQGESIDAGAPANSIVTAVGIERDGFRHENLAIAVSMLYETVDTSLGWAGLYLTNIGAQAMTRLLPEVQLTSSANPSLEGENVTFTAVVSGSAGKAGGGTVDFLVDGAPVAGCTAVALVSGAADCTTNVLAAGAHSALASYSGDSTYYGGKSQPLAQSTRANTGGVASNVALASAGAVATASSTYKGNYPPSATINGDRSGDNYGEGGVWNDANRIFPDWLRIQLPTAKMIDRAVVYSMQDDYMDPVDPSDTMTFNNFGVVDFQVQVLNGSAWTTVGTVVGNNLVKREVAFAAVTTSAVRIYITNAKRAYSRLAEVEVFTGTGSSGPLVATVGLSSSVNPSISGQSVTFTASVSGADGVATGTMSFTDNGAAIAGCSGLALSGGSASCITNALADGTHLIVANYSGDVSYQAGTSAVVAQQVQAQSGGTDVNVALASGGATATASSTYGLGYSAAAVIDGERSGDNNVMWYDGTRALYPDWVGIQLPADKTIDRVVVYTMQDDYTDPVDPSDTMTFNTFGIVDFQVQVWNGSAWATVGTVTGNNLVKRTVSFPWVTTNAVRVVVTNALRNYSRITEVEVWGR